MKFGWVLGMLLVVENEWELPIDFWGYALVDISVANTGHVAMAILTCPVLNPIGFEQPLPSSLFAGVKELLS